MTKFKVGDIVTGIRGHMGDYTFTTSEAKMRVTTVSNGGLDLEVEIMNHTRCPYKVGHTYRVESRNFKLCKPIMLENK